MTSPPRQLLIVDDEPELLASLSDAFSDEGYVVKTAIHGRDALEKLPSMGRPCVMILDLLMPIMSGNELYARMRADPRFADIPVVVATSDPSRSPAGLPVMKKPVSLDRMLSEVARLF